MHAQIAGLETCAAKACVQPVDGELGHLVDDPPGVVLMGYCGYHLAKIIKRRMAGLSDFYQSSSSSTGS
jgi:hypothetical protein